MGDANTASYNKSNRFKSSARQRFMRRTSGRGRGRGTRTRANGFLAEEVEMATKCSWCELMMRAEPTQ